MSISFKEIVHFVSMIASLLYLKRGDSLLEPDKADSCFDYEAIKDLGTDQNL